jgi:transposase-like protein
MDIFIRSWSSSFTRFTNFRIGTASSGLPVLRFFFLRGSAMTLPELNRLFSTDEDCREILTRLRWPEGVTCPRCQNKNVWWVESRKQFTCSECSYQFSVMTGTIFNDSHLPLPIWFMAVLLLCEAKKGMSALQLKRTIWGQHKGSYKTAWYLCHRIRAAMKEINQPMLDGTVEMDETYVGGKERCGRGWNTPDNNKEIVIGLRQRGGELRYFHANDVKSGTLAKYIKENVSADVDVMVTDEMPAYPKAMIRAGVHGSKHKTIRHKSKVYVDGDIHTNTVESAFSLLKRGIMGSWHKISAKHLLAYLDEMTFRFNRRKRSDLFIDTLRHMITAPVLTFDKLTA